MKRPARVGESCEVSVRVEVSHTIHLDPSLPPVLSTPSLLGLLEGAAIDVLRPLLDLGEVSVGVQVDLEHLAPTAVGRDVACRARVIRSDGVTVGFQLEAWAGATRVARGFHQRRVIRAAALARKLAS